MSEAIQKQIKLYLIIGLALFVGTLITVWVADLKVAIMTGIVIAVIIASIKCFLVAGYFMHLFHERKLIYQILLLTAVFMVVMIGLFVFAFGDQQGTHHGIFTVPAKHVTPADAGHGTAAHEPSQPAHHE